MGCKKTKRETGGPNEPHEKTDDDNNLQDKTPSQRGSLADGTISNDGSDSKEYEKNEKAEAVKVDARSKDNPKSESLEKQKSGDEKISGEKKKSGEVTKCANKTENGGNMKDGIMFLIYFIVVIASIIFAIISSSLLSEYFFKNVIGKGHSYNSKNVFLELLEEMKGSFDNQYPEYWRLLKNSGRRHLDRVQEGRQDDLRPMSLLIVAFEESAGTVDCYLEKVGKAYTYAPYTTIQSTTFKGDDSRMLLDGRIKDSLRGKQKLAIIKNIDKLSFDAAQLFMTYADEHNDVHTYPQSVILMTAVLPFPSSNNRKADESRVGDYFMEETWADQDTLDNKAALWSRVGDGIIIVRKEDKNPCETSKKEL